MKEHLLGYLVGALDSEDHETVEKHLREHPHLHADLERLRRGIEMLAVDVGHIDPPHGLAVRTCKVVADRRSTASSRVLAMPFAGARWGIQDLLVAAGIFIAASMLFFPWMTESRATARKAVCQDNLRAIGSAAAQYSELHNEWFPHVPASGKLASSGMFASLLHHTGFISEPKRFICPSCPLSKKSDFRIPSADELAAATPGEDEQLRKILGGSYGFTLGHLENGEYQPPRNRHRPRFALASDAPGSKRHGTCGHNVLFEDGHVDFLSGDSCEVNGRRDNIFKNDNDKVAPGLHADDAVIAPAWVRIEPALLENF